MERKKPSKEEGRDFSSSQKILLPTQPSIVGEYLISILTLSCTEHLPSLLSHYSGTCPGCQHGSLLILWRGKKNTVGKYRAALLKWGEGDCESLLLPLPHLIMAKISFSPAPLSLSGFPPEVSFLFLDTKDLNPAERVTDSFWKLGLWKEKLFVIGLTRVERLFFLLLFMPGGIILCCCLSGRRSCLQR